MLNSLMELARLQALGGHHVTDRAWLGQGMEAFWTGQTRVLCLYIEVLLGKTTIGLGDQNGLV